MLPKMRYRLALDLGSTSLGWAMLRLNANDEPCAVIKAGVRILSDGRNPKDGSSLAVTRRAARAMRRRRDRLLKRKARMMKALIEHGFFPADEAQRKALETLNPYTLRAKGLNEALTPGEFARALFHINQRRGFKSNRKTDKKENDSGALKTAIGTLRQTIAAYPLGKDGKPMEADQFDLLAWVERSLKETENEKPRTVGELLHERNVAGQPVRARYHQDKVIKDDGKPRINKYYDLYIDRAMIAAEFDALWAKQAKPNPTLFNEKARTDLKNVLLFQRKLKPVKAGRCTFMPEEERAPLALPSTQRFRMYQEVNNLRILREGLKEEPLTLKQRDDLIAALEGKSKLTFTQIKKLLGVGGTVQFNFEDPKRQEFNGNATSASLSKPEHFGEVWFKFDEAKQDAIVMQLVKEENETKLIPWLQDETGVDEQHADAIAKASLPEGYGSLCEKALARILPELKREILTYDKAVLAAGFEHHSLLWNFDEVPGRTFDSGKKWTNKQTGEIKNIHIFHSLPYYGEFLQRHVGFGSGKPEEVPEKRFGKIANPTVHIGLNQVRLVVNTLIKRYGRPSEVIVEVASELKRPADHRKKEFRVGKITKETMRRYCSCAGCVNVRQAINQELNKELRATAFKVLGYNPGDYEMEKMRLWKEGMELNNGIVICPYSGETLGVERILSNVVEIDHILPHSTTLDDSIVNKVLCLREANRIKRNRPPVEAKNDFMREKGWPYDDILSRVKDWPAQKRYRFGEDAMEKWKGRADTFLARSLNDTRHLSRVAHEYLTLICPNTRVIPGQMTALLRNQFGLDDILGLKGKKNRNDHRHHAVDACVIGVTDQGLLQRFAKASASARERQLNRLVESMPLPWDSYREHVQRAVANIWISHKPDHSYEACFSDDTAYRPPHLDKFGKWRTRGIGGAKPNEREADAALIAITETNQSARHSLDEAGRSLPYKGYMGGDNYAFEITRTDNGKWEGCVVTTYEAYQIVNSAGHKQLRHPTQGQNGKPLVMRLVAGDSIATETNGRRIILRAVKMRAGRNQVTLVGLNEANHANRMNEKDTSLVQLQDQSATALLRLRARYTPISPIGELRDPGFKE